MFRKAGSSLQIALVRAFYTNKPLQVRKSKQNIGIKHRKALLGNVDQTIMTDFEEDPGKF